jgi:hypothetical protein
LINKEKYREMSNPIIPDKNMIYLYDESTNSFVPYKAVHSARVPITTEAGLKGAVRRMWEGLRPDQALGVIVPLTKIKPNKADWVQLATIARKYVREDVIAIVNPSLDNRGVGVDGPGPDSDYLNGISMLRANGVRVVGFITASSA